MENKEIKTIYSITFLYEFSQKSSDKTDFLQWNSVVLILIAVNIGLWPGNALDQGLQGIKYKHFMSGLKLLFNVAKWSQNCSDLCMNEQSICVTLVTTLTYD